MSSAKTMQQAKIDATPTAQRSSRLSSQLAVQHQQNNASAIQSELTDLRPQATVQRQLQDAANNSPQSRQLNAFQQMAQNSARSMQLKAMSSMMNAPVVQRVEEDEPVNVEATAETVKRKHQEMDENSDLSDSDDDSTVELDHKKKLEYMIKSGKKTKNRLKKIKIERDKDSEKFNLDSEEKRKALAIHRMEGKTEISDISQQETVNVGKQNLRIGGGTGFFIQAGGNERSTDIKEPEAEYHKLYPELLGLGKDKVSKNLFNLATKKELRDKSELGDVELAPMIMHYMSSNVDDMEKELGERTQMSENLSKLTLITDFSEFSRGMKSDEHPFDASLLVKQGLRKIAEGEVSFEEMFYKGEGGENSIFLGAPSKTHSSDNIGGSELLQNPLEYDERLKRQMQIFPNKKIEFKQTFNGLKSRDKSKQLEMLSELDEETLKKQQAEQQIREANDLLKEIKNVQIPKAFCDRWNFWSDNKGFINRNEKKIQSMCSRFKGNEKALNILEDAKSQLARKRKKAMKP